MSSPEMWSCFLFYFLHLGSWAPSHSHCNQGCTQLLHPQPSLFSGMYGSRMHFCSMHCLFTAPALSSQLSWAPPTSRKLFPSTRKRSKLSRNKPVKQRSCSQAPHDPHHSQFGMRHLDQTSAICAPGTKLPVSFYPKMNQILWSYSIIQVQ